MSINNIFIFLLVSLLSNGLAFSLVKMPWVKPCAKPRTLSILFSSATLTTENIDLSQANILLPREDSYDGIVCDMDGGKTNSVLFDSISVYK